jgi:succinate-acetate transporter protein
MFRPGKDKGIATPIPLGLAALGVSTFLMGLALIAQPAAAWETYFTNALMMGGLAEFIAGMWAFAYGDPLAATVFSFVGAFYGWWGMNGLMVHGAALVPASLALVFIVCGVVVLCMWVASFNETAVFNLTLLFLWIADILMGIALAADVRTLAIIGGISALISGVIAAYGSFAELYNAASLEEVVPLGEPKVIRERSEHEEQERLRRLHAVVDHQAMHV